MSRKFFITGANGQLGKVFTNYFLNKGDEVLGLDIQKNGEISHSSYKYKTLDIRCEKSVVSLFEEFREVDVLINNAGIGVFTPFEERTAKEFMSVVSVNLLGTFLMCREAIKSMKKRQQGKIVNIGSVYGVVSSDFRIYGESKRNNSEVYSASKAGVIMMSKYLATHYAQDNIQVNSLSPGGVLRSQTNDFVEKYCDKTPAKRMGNPEDLLSTIELLTTDNSNYLTGQNITVDGGFSAW